VAAKDYVYGVKGPARVANQYKWTALKMKIKKIIKEELQKILKEQALAPGSFAAATAEKERQARTDTKAPSWMKNLGAVQKTMADKEAKTKASQVGKTKKSGDQGLIVLQKQLRRVGALDYNQNKIIADGLPGPKTATALASVTTLPCIGGSYCRGTSRFLKNKNLQRAAINVLKRMTPITPEESANKTVAALKRKMKPGSLDMKKGLALVDDAGIPSAKDMASGEGPSKLYKEVFDKFIKAS
tara:strand:- start:680 stop:1408 length:729 start_codon:yes stop_codon:yes gene_type:complete